MSAAEYLVRKIQIERWVVTSSIEDEGDIRPDSLTGRCLMTTDEYLSLWQCANDEKEIAQVALALATPQKKSSAIEGIALVLINKELLIKEGFTLQANLGESLIRDLNEKHIDVKLDLPKLIRIATEITLKLRNDLLFYQFTTRQLLSLLKKALLDGRIAESDIPKPILKQLAALSIK
jgi:hypothetical protein